LLPAAFVVHHPLEQGLEIKMAKVLNLHFQLAIVENIQLDFHEKSLDLLELHMPSQIDNIAVSV
jgi:hypothetical protein